MTRLAKVEFGTDTEHAPRAARRSASGSGGSSAASPRSVHLHDVVLEATLDGVVAHRADGALVYFNQAAHEMLGYTREQFSALPPFGWVGPRDLEEARERIEAILHDGSMRFESTAQTRSGAIIPTEVKAHSVDWDGQGELIVSVVRDTSERQATHRQLHYMAFHDPLTGLGNRAMFDEATAVAIAEAERHEDVLGLAFIDLDSFKPVNDRYGHAAGDAVLIEVGQRLDAICRRQDTLSRVGGDEFAVLLPRLSSEYDLGVVARRMIAAIEEPIVVEGREIRVSASAGLVIFEPGDTGRTMLRKADAAMYAAKRSEAGPRYVVDSPRMREE